MIYFIYHNLQTMENRRKFPRVDAAFEVKYYPVTNYTRYGYTISHNISKGGISMPALSLIAKPGETIKMDINTNDGKTPVSATGRVRWNKIRAREALLDEDIGVEFINIASADIEKLMNGK